MGSPPLTRADRIPYDLNGGTDLVVPVGDPDQVLRFWRENEAFPRIVVDVQNGAIRLGDGTVAPVLSDGSPWAHPSLLGASKRAATDLRMSSYDTNAASVDHTAAFSAALADAATLVAAGAQLVRIILDSRLTYQIGGAVTVGANGQFAQVPLPFSSTASGVIKFVGIPRGNDHSYIGMGQSGTVIKSTLGSAPSYVASRGIASIFGGPASFSSAHNSYASFSFLKFAIQDVTIRSASPVIAGIDCGWVAGFAFDGLLQFDTDQVANIPGGATFDFSLLTPCTAPQAIPLITPFSNDWYGTIGDTLVVSGWTCGPVIGEWVSIQRLVAFALTGAVLNLDMAIQTCRINHLTDWDNAYGIASCSPSSATPVSPSSPFAGSGYTGAIAAPVEIGTWNIQQSGSAPPVALDRVADLLDVNDICSINAVANVCKAGAVQVGALTLIGVGGTAVGAVSRTRIIDKFRSPAPHQVVLPASGVTARNPFFRDGVILSAGGTFSAAAVDGQVLPFTTIIPIRANGTYNVTYAGNPTVFFFST